jgi:hypothetical protein
MHLGANATQTLVNNANNSIAEYYNESWPKYMAGLSKILTFLQS